MNFVLIAGKMVNIDKLIFYNYDENKDTGVVTCHFVFSEGIILSETYENMEYFELALQNYGIHQIHTLKIIANIISTIFALKNKTKKINKGKKIVKMLKRIKWCIIVLVK